MSTKKAGFYLFIIFDCAGSVASLPFLQLLKVGAALCVGGGFPLWWLLIAEHGLQGIQASEVTAHGLSSCGSQAVEHRLNSGDTWTQLLSSVFLSVMFSNFQWTSLLPPQLNLFLGIFLACIRCYFKWNCFLNFLFDLFIVGV